MSKEVLDFDSCGIIQNLKNIITANGKTLRKFAPDKFNVDRSLCLNTDSMVSI
jgi:hypothetical protein